MAAREPGSRDFPALPGFLQATVQGPRLHEKLQRRTGRKIPCY